MLTNINKSNPQNHIKIYGNVIKTDILQIPWFSLDKLMGISGLHASFPINRNTS